MRRTAKTRISAAAGLIVVAFVACSQEASGPRSLDDIIASGKLVVLTRNAPTSYYLNDADQPEGPEYDLVEAFAASLGVETEYRLEDTAYDMLAALVNREADLAAAGLTITRSRSKALLFGPSYQQVTQQVVCRRGGRQPTTVAELTDVELTVTAGSSYVERLELLQSRYPSLKWKTADLGTELLLERVWREKTDCTVADSNIVDINRRYFPELQVAFDLSRPQRLAWAMPKSSSALQARVMAWFESEAGQLAANAAMDRYYGYIDIFDYVDTRAYVRRIGKRYPRYRRLFEQASAEHGLAVELLASMAYQESHWDPEAVSPTGVRGMMMLTQDTAASLGVDNRLDPAQSIDGGARYLAMIKENLSDAIEEPDRTWLALAAYNVGRAHLHDAQELARELGKDPHAWADIMEVLPLLSDERYYKSLKHGYARGLEPVRYVQRIRHYRDILERQLVVNR